MAELLADPNGRRIFLCTLTLGSRLRDWTASGGYDNTYQTAFPGVESGLRREIARVEENGGQYAAKSSVAGVDSAASAYYWDEESGTLYISPAGPDPTAASAWIVVWFTIRLSNESRDGSGRPLVLDGCRYTPIVSEIGTISERATDLFGSLGSSPVTCRLAIANGDGSLDEALKHWGWIGAEAVLLFGGDDLPLEEYETIFRGTVEQLSADDSAISLSLESGEKIFNRTVPPNSFSTAQFPDLKSSAEGKPIPLLFGRVDNVTPACIYTVEDHFLELDGDTQYAYRSNTDLVGIKFEGSFTIEVTLVTYDDTIKQPIAGIYNTVGNKRSYLLFIEGDCRIRFFLSSTGSDVNCARANDTPIRPLHKYTVRAAYDSAGQTCNICINGLEQSISITGSIPSSLYQTDVPFEVGYTGNTTVPNFKGRIYDLKLADGYYPGSDPLPSLISHWKFDGGLADYAGQNHLSGNNIDDDGYQLDYGLVLDGSTCAAIADSDQSGLDITGPLTIGARVLLSDTSGLRPIVSKWNENTAQRAYSLESDGGTLRLRLSSDGSAEYIVEADSTELQPGCWYDIKASYDTATLSARIFIDGVQQSLSTQGSSLSAIYNSSADFRVGSAVGPVVGLDGYVDFVALSNTWQDNSGPVTSLVSFWDFQKDLKDSVGSNDLDSNGVSGSDGYVALSTQSTYKLADDSLQRLQSVDAVRDGERLLGEEEYSVDLDACTLTLNVPIRERLYVDAAGAVMGDLLGNDSNALVTRAAYIAAYLLRVVAGQRPELFDDAGFQQGSADAPMELNLYVNGSTTLGEVLKQICDSVVADVKVSDGRYRFIVHQPSAGEGCIEIDEHDLSGFAAECDPDAIWGTIAARFAQDGAGNYSFVETDVPKALYLHGRDLARREFSIRLVDPGDAADFLAVAGMLARSRQLMVAASVITPALINHHVGDRIRLTRKRGLGAELQRTVCGIVAIEKDYRTGACRVRLSALGDIGDGVARFTAPDHPAWSTSDDAQKNEGGYFTSETGRADPADPDSADRNIFWR